MWRRRRATDPTYPTPLTQEWTERLDRHGSVEFFRSRRKLAALGLICLGFVLVAALILMTASTAHDRVISVLCLVLFGLALVPFAGMWFQRSPILRVDRSGLHLPRRTPLDVEWGQVVRIGTYKINRMAARQLRIWIWPDVYQDYLSRMPSLQRTLFRTNQRTQWRDCLAVQLLDVPELELAAWLDEQTDRLATPPSQLVLFPLPDESPLWGAQSDRPVAVEKLRLSTELTTALQEFAERAWPVAQQVAEGGSPGAAWGYLAGEGRELCVRLRAELGAGSVIWFEDVLQPA